MQDRKRIYLGLLVVSLLFIAGIFTGAWYLLSHQGSSLSRVVTTGIITAFILFFIIAAAGIVAIVITILREQNIPSLEGSIRIATALLFPLAVAIGRIFGIARERVWGSYIEVNNFLVRSYHRIFQPGKVVILAPHCLQNSKCPHKITMDVDNCKRCGKCNISDLIEVSERYGAILKVATGGTLARKIIKETRPQGVLAIACERDLSLGIHDMSSMPVIGILNRRPNGPCKDTEVDLGRVEKALQELITRGGV